MSLNMERDIHGRMEEGFPCTVPWSGTSMVAWRRASHAQCHGQWSAEKVESHSHHYSHHHYHQHCSPTTTSISTTGVRARGGGDLLEIGWRMRTAGNWVVQSLKNLRHPAHEGFLQVCQILLSLEIVIHGSVQNGNSNTSSAIGLSTTQRQKGLMNWCPMVCRFSFPVASVKC